jgi:hypothetical protein
VEKQRWFPFAPLFTTTLHIVTHAEKKSKGEIPSLFLAEFDGMWKSQRAACRCLSSTTACVAYAGSVRLLLLVDNTEDVVRQRKGENQDGDAV